MQNLHWKAVTQLINKFSAFVGLKVSLYYSTVSTRPNEPYSEPAKSSPHSQNLFTFLYLLVNNNASRSDYVAPNCRIISEWYIVKDVEVSDHDTIWTINQGYLEVL